MSPAQQTPSPHNAKKIGALSAANALLARFFRHLTQDPAKELREMLDPSGLIWAAGVNDLPKLKKLLSKEACAQTDWGGRTALMRAAMNNHVECVEALLPLSDANQQDSNGRAAFFLAASHGCWEAAETLAAATDCGRCEPSVAFDALLDAIESGRGACARALATPELALMSRADGATALMAATKSASLGLARLLLPMSDARAADRAGRTALMRAAADGDEEMVRLLAPLSDANAVDADGLNALMLAARSSWDNSACARELIPASNVHARGLDGKTALGHALENGHVANVEALAACALPEEIEALKNWAKGKRSEKAFAIAEERAMREAVEAIAAQGNGEGKTPAAARRKPKAL